MEAGEIMAMPWEKYAPEASVAPWDKYTSGPDATTAQMKKPAAIEPMTWLETQLSKLPSMSPKLESNIRGFVMGAADPSVGLVQLGANAIGQGAGINSAIAKKEAQYEAGRAGSGREGIDGSRLVGNVAAPANLLVASRLAPALAGAGRAVQGAANGAAGGLLQPVVDASGGADFITKKGAQASIGMVAGGILSPAIGKLGDVIGRQVARTSVTPQQATADAVKVISDALKEVGQTVNDVPPATMASLTKQVSDSLRAGKKLDAAALLRKSDFDALGMPSLRGQITRDSTQFAKEMNLRGALNLGEPIQQRMDQQAQILQSKVGNFSTGAKDAFQAGGQVSGALGAFDNQLRKNVSGLYSQARQSAGKDLDVPLQGMAQDYAEVLANFGDKVPSGVRNQLEALGLNKGVQTKVFTIEGADNLLKTINANVSNDPATNRALDVLRGSVKNAVTSIDDTGGVFAPAVKAAAQRFKMHDAIPALEAAANGKVAPDDFVRRFVTNGKTEEVQGLAKVLQQADPEAFQQARAQIGEDLKRAAFGENTAGDKTMSADRFATALRKYGKAKLSAFFTPAEVEQMHVISRVAAFKNSTPSNAAVNYSNTGSAVMNLLGRFPGAPAALSVGNAIKNTVNNSRTVNSSMSAAVPSAPVQPTAKFNGLLSSVLGSGAVIGGGLLGGTVR